MTEGMDQEEIRIGNSRTFLISSVTAFIFIVTFTSAYQTNIESVIIQTVSVFWALSVLTNFTSTIIAVDFFDKKSIVYRRRLKYAYNSGFIIFQSAFLMTFGIIFPIYWTAILALSILLVMATVIFLAKYKLQKIE